MAEEQQKKEDAGVPAWVMTFADLMTLLMCFFVLLLAFSEMDAAKFKQLAGSMKEAFGVQNEIEVRTIPKGTSVVAQEFSPGRPEPTPINTIRQFTIDSNRNTLDLVEREVEEIERARDQARNLRIALAEEIERGDVEIETEGTQIIVRIMEQASFLPGTVEVSPEFIPVLEKIAGLIDNTSGQVSVSGHTDNQPISNGRYRSNWELSSSRAVSVAHLLLDGSDIDDDRVEVTGHADTRPRDTNDTPEGRARNRRVEMLIRRADEAEQDGDGANAEPDEPPEEVFNNAPT